VSVIVAIADLVAAELTAASASGTLPETFTAERVFRPVTKLEDAEPLRVLVAPTGIERQLVARMIGAARLRDPGRCAAAVAGDEAFTDALALCEANRGALPRDRHGLRSTSRVTATPPSSRSTRRRSTARRPATRTASSSP
jgi:hypothetical protein